MQQWSWPGNVRELVNRIRKAIVMCEKGPLYSSDLDLDFDNRVHGHIDQINQQLVLDSTTQDLKKYQGLEKWSAQLRSLHASVVNKVS